MIQVLQIVKGDNLIGDDWMVSRKFIKNKKEIWIKGFGKTSRDAMMDFESEVAQEKLYK